MPQLLRIAAVLLAALVSASADCVPTVEHTIYIEDDLGSPIVGAGPLLERVLITANGTIPGPEIRVKVHDCVKVNIINKLMLDPISIHYHGILQTGSPWEDGTAHLSECPVLPGASRTHVFKADVPGTFWYHSHVASQVVDGLYGAFIVEDALPDGATEQCFPPNATDTSSGAVCVPTDKLQELNVVLSDWWTKDSRTQDAGLGRVKFAWIGDPQAVLINGVGTYDPVTGGPAYDNSTAAIVVERGTTYRLRIICAAGLSYMRFAIEGHNMTLIAVDGQYVQPVETDSIDCGNGERYDILVAADAPEADGGLYWAVAQSRYRAVTVAGAARVIYKDVADAEWGNAADMNYPDLIPPSNVSEIIAAVPPSAGPDAATAAQAAIDFEKQIVGLVPVPPGEPNVKLHYIMSQQRMSEDGRKTYTPYNADNKTFTYLPGNDTAYLKWALNDISYHHEDTPVLLAAYLKLYKDEYQPHPLTYELFKGDYVQIVVQGGIAQNGGKDQHPMHLHGHSFWVVGSGVGDYNKDTDPQKFNLDKPAYKDTVVVYPGSWAAIRFVADNPGAWPFHCHVAAHFSVMGMGMVFLERQKELPAPPAGYDVCGRVSADFKHLKLNQGYYAEAHGSGGY